jgi:hypothetical protein
MDSKNIKNQFDLSFYQILIFINKSGNISNLFQCIFNLIHIFGLFNSRKLFQSI